MNSKLTTYNMTYRSELNQLIQSCRADTRVYQPAMKQFHAFYALLYDDDDGIEMKRNKEWGAESRFKLD